MWLGTLPFSSMDINGTLLPIGINRLLRLHWAVRKKEQQKFIADITDNNPHVLDYVYTEPVCVEYTRKSIKYMDWDNAAGSFKLLGDGLVQLGVLPDDNPEIIPEFIVKQEKVKHRNEQGYTINIRPASPL